MTLGEWLNQMILEDGADAAAGKRVALVRPLAEAHPAPRPGDDFNYVLSALDDLTRRFDASIEEQNRHTARVEAAIVDLRADQGRSGERLRAIELADGSAVSKSRLDALRSLEGALSKVAVHMNAGEVRQREAMTELRRELGGEMRRMAEEVNRRIIDVDNRNADAVAQVSAEVARVSQSVEHRLRRADDAQAEALERLGGEIARITERLSERIAAAERRSADSVDSVGEQISRVTERLHQRQDHAESELADRIRKSEERTALLLDEARATIDRTLARREAHEAVASQPDAFAFRWSTDGDSEEAAGEQDTVTSEAAAEPVEPAPAVEVVEADHEAPGPAQAALDSGAWAPVSREIVDGEPDLATRDVQSDAGAPGDAAPEIPSPAVEQPESRPEVAGPAFLDPPALILTAASNARVPLARAASPLRGSPWPTIHAPEPEPVPEEAEAVIADETAGAAASVHDSELSVLEMLDALRQHVEQAEAAYPELAQSDDEAADGDSPVGEPVNGDQVLDVVLEDETLVESLAVEAEAQDQPPIALTESPPSDAEAELEVEAEAHGDAPAAEASQEPAPGGSDFAEAPFATSAHIEEPEISRWRPQPEPVAAFDLSARRARRGGPVRGALLAGGAAAFTALAASGYVALHPELLQKVRSPQAKGTVKSIPVGPASAPAHAPAPSAVVSQTAAGPTAQIPAPQASIALAGQPTPKDDDSDLVAMFRAAAAKVDAGDGSGVAALRAAADQGYAPAQRRLGKLYEDGGAGMRKDDVEGRNWTQRAAAQGDARAMHNLGLDYYEGTGGPKSALIAADWFKRAAEMGLRDSQFNLARFYEAGIGVKQNLAYAYKWYLIAGSGGDTEATARGEAVKVRLSTADKGWAEHAAATFRPDTPAAPLASLKGANAKQLALAQRALAKLGYYRGGADGLASDALGEAIQAYQRDRGLAGNGQLSPELVQSFAHIVQ